VSPCVVGSSGRVYGRLLPSQSLHVSEGNLRNTCLEKRQSSDVTDILRLDSYRYSIAHGVRHYTFTPLGALRYWYQLSSLYAERNAQ
jgi:hypothetical protein